MKKFVSIILPLLFILIAGCNDDSGTGTNPFGGGGGTGTGNVTIQVQGQADGQGNYIFSISPSVGISLTSVTASVPAQQYQETININEQYQAGAFQGVLQYPANQIQTGQQWTFKFVGTITNGNQNFDVTTNHTIP